jgi:transcriptional regulator with XRE-family HTH domain
MAQLGDRIKERRLAHRWSLEDLAERARISKSFLSDLENGKQKNVGVQYLTQIANALGVSAHFLMTGNEPDQSRRIQMPTSLLNFAKQQQLSVNQMMMLLDARRQIVSHRSEGRSDDLEDFDWKPFYEALKPYLK